MLWKEPVFGDLLNRSSCEVLLYLHISAKVGWVVADKNIKILNTEETEIGVAAISLDDVVAAAAIQKEILLNLQSVRDFTDVSLKFTSVILWFFAATASVAFEIWGYSPITPIEEVSEGVFEEVFGLLILNICG